MVDCVFNINRRKSIINLCAQHLCDIYVDLRSKRAVRVSPWLNIFNGKTDIINRFLQVIRGRFLAVGGFPGNFAL